MAAWLQDCRPPCPLAQTKEAQAANLLVTNRQAALAQTGGTAASLPSARCACPQTIWAAERVGLSKPGWQRPDRAGMWAGPVALH